MQRSRTRTRAWRFKGNRVSSIGDVRNIPLGLVDGRTNMYPNNRLKSSKYTIWNFLPLNLFQQFRRIANFYFFTATIIVMSMDSPVSPWTSLLPLLFVVSVTAVKQGYEDLLRHRQDNEVNLAPVTVIRNGVSQEMHSERIQVGDLVMVSCEQDVPCDMVLVASSLPNARCYVTTANLDGESNLKTMHLPPPLRSVRTASQLMGVQGCLECEQPHADLYRFHGRLELSAPVAAPPESQRLSMDSFSARFRQDVEPDTPDTGDELVAPLSSEHLLLKGSRLRNTQYVFGCAVYTGKDTKMALNSLITRNKFSSLEKSINCLLIIAMLMQVLLVVVCVVGSATFLQLEFVDHLSSPLHKLKEEVTAHQVIVDILAFLILFNYLIPISLYVTMEMQKFLGSFFFCWDNQMYCPDNNRPAVCNSSDLNEELGLVEYVFSDKTGTLTENAMVFRRCCINGVAYLESDGKLYELPSGGEGEPRGAAQPELTEPMEHFFLALALCHSSQMDYCEQYDVLPASEFKYDSSSPDERALLQASARCGIVFLGESDGYYIVRVRGAVRAYRRLEILEFTSDRKRMSVIVRDPGGAVWLFCKGAESAVLPLVELGQKAKTSSCTHEFALRGLRTMLVACRWIPREEHRGVLAAIRCARGNVAGARESLVAAACQDVERGLTLLGATAVEDRLQPGVREALSNLRVAGIKTWILTGDKLETAVSISLSSRHFQLDTELLFLTEHSTSSAVLRTLRTLKQRISSSDYAYGLVVDGKSLEVALDHASDLLLEVGQACSAVVCCRLSPLQKCQVVRLIKNSPQRPITAAIGDGANDVSMIQEAHVGLGIMGKEGRQAERSSDFALARFRFIQRALLVHGHWFYYRLSQLVHYFFYKNVVFILPQFYFTIYSSFSKQSLFNSVFLTCFNIIFTSIPVLVFGLLEQNRPSYQLLQYPHLYKKNKGNHLMKFRYFAVWLLAGIWHSLVVFFVPVFAVQSGALLLTDGSEVDMSGIGSLVYNSAVIVVNVKLLLMSKYWTAFLLTSIGVSLVFLFVINIVYSAVNIEKILNPQMYFLYVKLLGSPNFWFLILLTPCTALLPDIILQVVTNTSRARHDPTLRVASSLLCCIQAKTEWPVSMRTEFNRNSGRISIVRPHRETSGVLVHKEKSIPPSLHSTKIAESRQEPSADEDSI